MFLIEVIWPVLHVRRLLKHVGGVGDTTRLLCSLVVLTSFGSVP
jgi:hypothetical protein